MGCGLLLFFTDTATTEIYTLSLHDALPISTLAGTGTPGYSVDLGAPAGAQVNTPRGLAADASGNVYLADTRNSRVRKIAPGGNIFTYAGNGNAGYFGDIGPANKASVNQPE